MPDLADSQVGDVVPAAELERMYDQARPGVGDSPIGNQVEEEGKPRRDGAPGKASKFSRRFGQGLAHGRPGLELDGEVAEQDGQAREDPVVLLEADRQPDEEARPEQVPGPAVALPGKKPLEGGQGQHNRHRRVEGKGPGREGPDGEDEEPRHRREPPCPACPRRDDTVSRQSERHVDEEDQHPGSDHAGVEEREDSRQGEPDAGRDEGIHVPVEHPAIEEVECLLEEVAFIRKDDGRRQRGQPKARAAAAITR